MTSVPSTPCRHLHVLNHYPCSSSHKTLHPLQFSHLLHLRHRLNAFHTTCMPSATPTRLPYHLYASHTTYTPPAPLTPLPHRLHTFHNHLHAITPSAVGIGRHVDMVETQRPAFVGNLGSGSR